MYEQGGASVVGGAAFHTLANDERGRLPLDALAAALDVPDDPHFARPALVCVEQTHNRCGGSVLEKSYLERVRQLADGARVPIHMDGARLANAAAVLGNGDDWTDACTGADTVSVCLSKGLGAPIGSVLAGPAPFIDAARRTRKLVGGGMRQVGIIAAPGLVALQGWHARLTADHANAAALARGLAAIDGINVTPPQTNIVLFDGGAVVAAPALVAGLAARGVLVAAFRGRVRAVTSGEVGEDGVKAAVAAVKEVVDDARAGRVVGEGGAAY